MSSVFFSTFLTFCITPPPTASDTDLKVSVIVAEFELTDHRRVHVHLILSRIPQLRQPLPWSWVFHSGICEFKKKDKERKNKTKLRLVRFLGGEIRKEGRLYRETASRARAFSPAAARTSASTVKDSANESSGAWAIHSTELWLNTGVTSV